MIQHTLLLWRHGIIAVHNNPLYTIYHNTVLTPMVFVYSAMSYQARSHTNESLDWSIPAISVLEYWWSSGLTRIRSRSECNWTIVGAARSLGVVGRNIRSTGSDAMVRVGMAFRW